MKTTPRQQAAFKLMTEKMRNHEPALLGQIMREVGYSAATAINPTANLVNTEGWQTMKNSLDRAGAIQTFNELVSSKNKDSRTRITAAIEITKITGGYPAQENKVIGLFGKLEDIQDEPNRISEENQLLSSSGATEGAGVQE